MPKAPPAVFAAAKRLALRALSQQEPDGFVPDRVQFFNDEHGFIVRLANLGDDHHYQRMVSWTEFDLARGDIVGHAVSIAVENLARAQGESI